MHHKILCLSAHTDDSELGAGASIAKWRHYGAEVKIVSFSATKDRSLLISEQMNAAKVFNVQDSNIEVLSFTVRKFSDERQKILDTMLDIGNKYKPDLILCPSSHDSHQDHTTIYQEAIRAFRNVSMMGYECPWNNREFSTDIFSVVKDWHIAKKIEALACYKSQRDKVYMKEDYTKSLAMVHGATVKELYAESFQCLRWII